MPPFHFSLPFFLHTMTPMMILVLTPLSFILHIYTIPYIHHQKVPYQPFFTYISF
ncbi:hypothetical protein, partial [Neisseria sicca]|uniref:hypothetical protein n=1 Tax=Neisseria sicca TaxID=490 RepID=UPI001649897F